MSGQLASLTRVCIPATNLERPRQWVCLRFAPVRQSLQASAPSERGVVGELGMWSREIGRILTKSLKLRYGTNRVAHFVWEKCRAQTTYIVQDVPRKSFGTL
jgi:hypothetical protein